MKKSKKVLSVVLALVMAFSALAATFAASAADDKAYTPKYTEISTKEAVTNTLTAVDGLVAGLVGPLLADNVSKDKLVPMLTDLLNTPIQEGSAMTYLKIISFISPSLTPVLADLDHLLNVTLGLKVGMPFEAKGDGTYNLAVDAATMANGIADFVNNLVNALKDNLVTKVLDLLPIIAQEDTLIEIGKTIEDVMPLIKAIGGFVDLGDLDLVGMISGLLTDSTQEVEAAPVADEETTGDAAPVYKQMLDVNAIIPTVLKLAAPDLEMTFSEIDTANLAAQKDTADTFMVVYHYVYTNVIGNEANLKIVRDAINGLVAGLDESTKALIDSLLPSILGSDTVAPLSEDDLLDMIVGLLGGDPVDDTTTAAPSTTAPSTTAPSNNNPKTGDAALGAVAMITLAAAAAFVMTKKKA